MSDPVVSGEPPRSPETPAGTPTPTVSVLVRSMGRPSLERALESIARQTLDGLEVVVVSASGLPHPPLPAAAGRHPIRLHETGRPLARAAAANAALAQARGRWLIFLDDDDRFDPDHLERLHAALQRETGARVAYAGVRLVDAEGRPTGELDEPFDPVRLWNANYLPMHAVMFARELLDSGLHFDESFDVYEDWDFWRQLSLGERFVHVEGVSATYCLVGNSGLSQDADARTANQGRERFYRKWWPRLGAEQLQLLATAGEHQRIAAREHERRAACLQVDLSTQQAATADREARLAVMVTQRNALVHHAGRLGSELTALQSRINDLEADRAAIAHARDELRLQVQGLSADLDHTAHRLATTAADYQRLEQGYRQLLGSLSWRVTAPLRRARELASSDGLRRGVRAVLHRLPLSAAARHRLKQRLASVPVGASLLRWVGAGQSAESAPAQAATTPAALDKEAVRAEAEAELTRFLVAHERIGLPHPPEPPDVSVVMVLYNQAGLSLLALRALAATQDVRFETLIVDNASTDRVPDLLDRVDGATVLRQSENLGFLRAVNLAAASARGRHLLLLNNDALVEPATLRHAVGRLDVESDAGAVGGPILLWDGSLQEAGSIVWRDGACQGYGRGDSPARPEYRFVRDVDYCSGAFLLVRRQLFERLGRFDEAFAPAYYEESDLCVRLWESGHRVVYDPAVRIKHFEFASDTGGTRAMELQARHREIFVAKHRDYLVRRPDRLSSTPLHARSVLRTGRPRVLVIDDRVPYPALGRGYPRASLLARSIAARAAALTYYPLVFPADDWNHVHEALDPRTEVMLDHGAAGLGAFLTSRTGEFDIVIVSRPHNMQQLAEVLRRQTGCLGDARLVYDAEALFSLREVERARVLGTPMDDAAAQRLLGQELALAGAAQRIVAVSEAEAEHYRRNGCGDVVVLGHALAPRPSAAPFERRSGFLFVGAVTDAGCPNGDSLRWFVEHVWPVVCARLGPEAVLDVVGVCESDEVRALASGSIRFHGRVDDLDPFFEVRRVFIVPTRFAAGVPHKAHEAASRGLPMVTSALIAAQLGWRDELLVGLDAGDFAQACLRLHREPDLWHALRAGLLAAVERDCSIQAFDAAVDRVLA